MDLSVKKLINEHGFNPSKELYKLIDKGAHDPDDLKWISLFLKIKLNGIFSMYNLPKKLKNGGYIMLIHPEGTTFGHWVAFYLNKKNLFYFDSYGMPPPEQVVHLRGSRDLMHNDLQIQAINANHCGMFCLLWLHAINVCKDKVRGAGWFTSRFYIINDFSPIF